MLAFISLLRHLSTTNNLSDLELIVLFMRAVVNPMSLA